MLVELPPVNAIRCFSFYNEPIHDVKTLAVYKKKSREQIGLLQLSKHSIVFSGLLCAVCKPVLTCRLARATSAAVSVFCCATPQLACMTYAIAMCTMKNS